MTTKGREMNQCILLPISELLLDKHFRSKKEMAISIGILYRKLLTTLAGKADLK